MPNGYCGKILRVNLSDGKISTESPEERFYRMYGGGRGFISHTLLRELRPGIDPLGPDNKVIFATGVLTGNPVPGTGRHSVGAKSPLTGGYGDGEAGGFWGTELKRAGFDAVIIEGAAKKPVYLWIHDGECEIKDGAHLWGRLTLEAQKAIQSEVGQSGVHVAQIGPAGEKRVRYACVVHDLRHFAGRCGIGAVMGSKNLKAVVVKGSESVKPFDSEAAKGLARWLAENQDRYLAGFKKLGTWANVESLSSLGGLPTRNFREGVFEDADKIGATVFSEKFLTGRESCYACPVRCKPKVEIGEPYHVSADYGGPEYETIASLGSNCGVNSPEMVSVANQICNAYGLDTISAGVCVAFAMECFEKGIIGPKETGGIDLRFGNAQAMVEMTEKIGKREGFGDVLAEGVMRASRQIGRGAEALAMHVKGQEVPLHEPRLKQGLGIGLAVSPTGADHHHNIHDTLLETESKAFKDLKALGILETIPSIELSPRKTRMFMYVLFCRSLGNSLGLCTFVPWDCAQIEDILTAATGWSASIFEIVKMTERAMVLARLFNLREGFKGADDTIPSRFNEEFVSGPLKGVSVKPEVFDQALKLYYGMMGWKEDGTPSEAKLYELGLDWACGLLAQ